MIAVTGGGSGAISALLTTRGASRSILAATVPYAPAALSEWLGARPDEFCSAWTARAMAMAAFLKARQYDPDAVTCGVACTASLASDRPKRGPHRAHFAFQTAGTTAALSLELEKGRRSRFDAARRKLPGDAVRADLDLLQARQFPQIHQKRRLCDAKRHHRHQAHPAREQLDVVAAFGQKG